MDPVGNEVKWLTKEELKKMFPDKMKSLQEISETITADLINYVRIIEEKIEQAIREERSRPMPWPTDEQILAASKERASLITGNPAYNGEDEFWHGANWLKSYVEGNRK